MGLVGSNETLIETVSGEELTLILREMGFSPELKTDRGGDPLVSFQIEGLKCFIACYGCQGARATSLQFGTGFSDKKPLETINAFNRATRFGKAYLDSDGDLMLTLDLALQGGVSRKYLEEMIRRWRGVFVGLCRSMSE